MTMKKTKILLGIMTALGVIFIIALLAFFIRPLWKDTHRLAGEITEKQVELDAQYTQLKQLLESNENIIEANGVLDGLRDRFVSPGQELDFITAVETIADEEDVRAEIVLAIPPPRKDRKPEIPELVEDFEINFNGDFKRIHRAITSLERLPQITVTEFLAIRALRSRGADDPPSASALIRGKLAFPPADL